MFDIGQFAYPVRAANSARVLVPCAPAGDLDGLALPSRAGAGKTLVHADPKPRRPRKIRVRQQGNPTPTGDMVGDLVWDDGEGAWVGTTSGYWGGSYTTFEDARVEWDAVESKWHLVIFDDFWWDGVWPYPIFDWLPRIYDSLELLVTVFAYYPTMIPASLVPANKTLVYTD